MAFKRMTLQQRGTLRALKELGGEIAVTPQTARPLHALKRRGLVRFGRVDGFKVARLRAHAVPERIARERAGSWPASNVAAYQAALFLGV